MMGNFLRFSVLALVLSCVGCEVTRSPGWSNSFYDSKQLREGILPDGDFGALVDEYEHYAFGSLGEPCRHPSSETREPCCHPSSKFRDRDSINPVHAANVRNEIITASIICIDANFLDFEKHTSRNHQALNIGGDLAQTGLTLGSTLTGSKRIKTTLSAIATATGAGKLTVDKNLFYKQTLPVLIKQMQAARTKQLAVLLAGKKKSIVDYPLELAVGHLLLYYEAGSIHGSLASVSDSAAKEKEHAEEAVEKVSGNFFHDDATDYLETRLNGDPGFQARLEAFMADAYGLDKSGDMLTFLYDDDHARERMIAARYFANK